VHTYSSSSQTTKATRQTARQAQDMGCAGSQGLKKVSEKSM